MISNACKCNPPIGASRVKKTRRGGLGVESADSIRRLRGKRIRFRLCLISLVLEMQRLRRGLNRMVRGLQVEGLYGCVLRAGDVGLEPP